jgi:hypothetical protein
VRGVLCVCVKQIKVRKSDYNEYERCYIKSVLCVSKVNQSEKT